MPSSPSTTPRCFVCERTDQDSPLVQLRYQGKILWICPQDLPALIHHPEQVAEKLSKQPGTETDSY